MSVTSFYPVLMSSNVTAAASFYREAIGFETTFASDWYTSLKLGVFELAILAHDHETIPQEYRALPQGVIVNLEVEDATTVFERFRSNHPTKIIQELKDENFGQRHFIALAPDGILLDVIQPIPPSSEYADSYV